MSKSSRSLPKRKGRPPLAFCLAVSHADIVAAKLWLRWAVHLSWQGGGNVSHHRLLIFLTKRVSEADEREIRETIAGARKFFNTTIQRCRDEDERGYPGSSSHLFCRALQSFNEMLTGYAMMFCEADTVPTRPTWAQELADEYARHSTPFVGLHIASTREAVDRWGFPAFHLTGNAMYPPNALHLAPSIEQCLVADTSDCPWGDKGWAWDLFCAHEMIPESAQTDKIQQIWRSDPWTPANINRLSPSAALFHQSKDGTLILNLALRGHQDFLDHLPASGRCYMLESGARSITLSGVEIKFRAAVRSVGGRIIGIHRPAVPMEDLLLASAAGRAGLTTISAPDYDKLLAQADRNPLDWM